MVGQLPHCRACLKACNFLSFLSTRHVPLAPAASAGNRASVYGAPIQVLAARLERSNLALRHLRKEELQRMGVQGRRDAQVDGEIHHAPARPRPLRKLPVGRNPVRGSRVSEPRLLSPGAAQAVEAAGAQRLHRNLQRLRRVHVRARQRLQCHLAAESAPCFSRLARWAARLGHVSLREELEADSQLRFEHRGAEAPGDARRPVPPLRLVPAPPAATAHALAERHKLAVLVDVGDNVENLRQSEERPGALAAKPPRACCGLNGTALLLANTRSQASDGR